MKKLLFLIIILSLSSVTPHKAAAQGDVYVSYQDFYDNLSPYGQWVEDPQYGYVWVPNVDDDFRPYFTDGHWVLTEYGNTWVSDFPWGWACFHYGRWIYNDFYGWLWVPGSEWGPGWVAWRWGGGFCGWAPLYPGVVWNGYAYVCPDDWWIFMHPRYLYRPRYINIWRSDFVFGPHRTHTIIHKTNFVTNTYDQGGTKYFSGPRSGEVQQVTHHPVQVFHLGTTPVRGVPQVQNGTVSIYRPARIAQQGRDGSHLAPAQAIKAPQAVTRPEQVKVKWDTPRPFKETMRSSNPSWERPYVRNAPPYDTRANGNGQQGSQSTNRAPSNWQQGNQPRPAPQVRQQSQPQRPQSQPSRAPAPARRTR